MHCTSNKELKTIICCYFACAYKKNWEFINCRSIEHSVHKETNLRRSVKSAHRIMQVGTSPRICSSKKRVVYKPSEWSVHQFEIWSGDLVCRAVALRVRGALLLWLGGGGPARLRAVALGLPPAPPAPDALGAALLGAGPGAAGLARRLAAALRRPVYVCSGAEFDRLTMPLVERGLVAEIKSRPDCF